jgi:2-polyprenyl-6-hydroxyphenyl methylase/3-demethylubiquinone-9 3-methyltransferase
MENLDPRAQDHFGALAATWWDPSGPNRALHDINACRLGYVQAHVALGGARVLDAGCGGGILSEALAGAGARVTAIDASAPLIEVARAHARAEGLAIDYRTASVAAFAGAGERDYDVVTCMELIEHVPDADALIRDCARCLAPGGTLVLSTINRNAWAWLFGIVAAEYLLDLVPRGTHDYRQLLRPSELAASARRHRLMLTDVSGMRYNPLTRRATLTAQPHINYLACCILNPA